MQNRRHVVTKSKNLNCFCKQRRRLSRYFAIFVFCHVKFLKCLSFLLSDIILFEGFLIGGRVDAFVLGVSPRIFVNFCSAHSNFFRV